MSEDQKIFSAVFRVAFQRWTEAGASTDLLDLVQEALDELSTIVEGLWPVSYLRAALAFGLWEPTRPVFDG
jgi:hypothetical protein